MSPARFNNIKEIPMNDKIQYKELWLDGRKIIRCRIKRGRQMIGEGYGATRKAARDAAIIDKQLMAGGVHLTEYGSEWMKR